jgi:hypothetical protein
MDDVLLGIVLRRWLDQAAQIVTLMQEASAASASQG